VGRCKVCFDCIVNRTPGRRGHTEHAEQGRSFDYETGTEDKAGDD
jgi:hypothetical protein